MVHEKDRLVLFGYGLFETLKVNQEQMEVPDLHYKRMAKGAELLGLPMPDYETWLAQLQAVIDNSIEQLSSDSYALRVTLSGGGGEGIPPQWLYHIRPIPYTAEDYAKGIKVVILSSRRNEYSPSVQIKNTNYLDNLLGKKEAEEQGAREGIWLNSRGFLAEGTMSNLFWVKDGVLYTPALSCGCLPGTRRQLVLECAERQGIPYEEGEFPLDILKKAEEVFLTNALMGIMPVSKIGEMEFPVQENGRANGGVNGGTNRGSIRSLITEEFQKRVGRSE